MYEFVFGKAAEWRHTALLFNYHFFGNAGKISSEPLQSTAWQGFREMYSVRCSMFKNLVSNNPFQEDIDLQTFVASIYLPLLLLTLNCTVSVIYKQHFYGLTLTKVEVSAAVPGA